MSNILLNATKLSDPEMKIIAIIRSLELFDSVEIKYSKQGELSWNLTRKFRGVYPIDIDNG